jgi:hypothetical protein
MPEVADAASTVMTPELTLFFLITIGVEIGVLFCLGIGTVVLALETRRWRQRRAQAEAHLAQYEREKAVWEAFIAKEKHKEGQWQ